MADDAVNKYKKDDGTTGTTEIGFSNHLTIPTGLKGSMKLAALEGFEEFQAWLVANMPAGSSKTWHTSTAPAYAKTFIWESAKL